MTDVSVDWGVRYPSGNERPFPDRDQAARMAAWSDGGVLIWRNRRGGFVGPWRETTTPDETATTPDETSTKRGDLS